MSNVSAGNQFEREFCEKLANYGFWVHHVPQNKVGQQPADVIAVYKGKAFLIDCKVCSNDVFMFSRMEENQRMAMDKWIYSLCGTPYFALKDSTGEIFMLDYNYAKALESEGHSGIACKSTSLSYFVTTLKEWVERVTA